ncbi:unnamed protein product [Meloidogyne enterolobii]|uniref:Uncharacterized protein n=1 Tax=Meloidogyne enterolobii TaxID=390850 RepID=A0ACB0Y867_MELEN
MEMTVLGNRVSILTADGHKVVPIGGKMGDYFEGKDGKLRKGGGLGWLLAAFFVVADMAGGGIVALPTAVVRCQFFPGLILLAVMALISTFSAVMLGNCWEILVRRFPDYRTHCRKPYAEIGYRALGPLMKTIVSTCVNITQFGASTVFLLLSAKNIRDFLRAFFHVDISSCLLVLVVALVLLPVTLLKSPNDFWPVIVGGMLSTGIAIVLICLGAFLDIGSCSPVREFPQFSLSNYLVALGTMLFTYGGHSAFPTIQHDMKRPSHFDRSAIFGFILMSFFNFGVVSLTGLVYGNSLRDSVINSIQTVWIQQAVNLMITAHCLLTVTLIINPLNQEVEELFDVPHEFCWKRVVVRTGVMASIVFVAESVPSFGPVLDFFGGSTVALTSVIFPCLFYLFLAAGEKKANESAHFGNEKPPTLSEMIQRTDRRMLFICGFVIVLSSLAGIIATISALISLMGTAFTPPCYLSHLFVDKNLNNNFNNESILANSSSFLSSLSATNCCGPFQNISRYGSTNGNCIAADLHFY